MLRVALLLTSASLDMDLSDDLLQGVPTARHRWKSWRPRDLEDGFGRGTGWEFHPGLVLGCGGQRTNYIQSWLQGSTNLHLQQPVSVYGIELLNRRPEGLPPNRHRNLLIRRLLPCNYSQEASLG